MAGRLKVPSEVKLFKIQLLDKLYDINTSEISEPSPEFFITNPIPYKMGMTDSTPTFDKLFESWVGKDNIKTLYQILAYCLYSDYPIHRMFYLTGSGSNGKSTFLKILMKFLGVRNICASELDALIERFGSTVVYKKLACLMGETDFTQLKKTSMLKKLSSGDLIDFEFKGKDRFAGYSYAKLIVATNNLPQTYDRSDGFYRRMLIIDFPNKFTKEIDILSQISEKEYENLVNKCVKLLRELLSSSQFNNEGDIEERRKKYEEYSNPLGMFIEQHCDVNINNEIPIFEFYDAFINFCNIHNKRKPSSKISLSQDMNALGFETKTLRRSDENGDSKVWKHYLGICLKEKTYISNQEISEEFIKEYGKNIQKTCNVTNVTNVTQSSSQNTYIEMGRKVSNNRNTSNITQIEPFSMDRLCHIPCKICHALPTNLIDGNVFACELHYPEVMAEVVLQDLELEKKNI
jgi:putative DNA primase/helicase